MRPLTSWLSWTAEIAGTSVSGVFLFFFLCACVWQNGKEKPGLILQPLLTGMGISKQGELPA